MNALSWLLYAAEVSSNIKWASVAAMVLCGIMLAIVMVGLAVSAEITDKEEAISARRFSGRLLRWTAPVLFVAFLVHAFVPTRDTIMLIAVSEVGETIISSEGAREIGGEAGQLATDSLRLLRKYVSEQLGETEAE